MTISQVLDIHQRQIQRFGGTSGVRDESLLDSALAQPKLLLAANFSILQFTSKQQRTCTI
ncbi:Fic family protein [Nostoc commune]|uniref:Fic family protein n=1 Tax=Nostoc commune TaxID=1178 RepID=UPI0020734D0B|nr:Fic family protein [Nostoc commune]